MYIYTRILLLCLLLSIVGCKDSDSTTDTSGISEDFILNDTWYFQQVSAEGEISGIKTEDEDPDPTGFITFNPDGTGVAEFGIRLLNIDYGKTENITWERTSFSEVTIIESDGDIDEWVLIRANDNIIEAEWELVVTSENKATFTAILTRNP